MIKQLDTLDAFGIAFLCLLIGAILTWARYRLWGKPTECDGRCGDPMLDDIRVTEECAWKGCDKQTVMQINGLWFCSWDHVPPFWLNKS